MASEPAPTAAASIRRLERPPLYEAILGRLREYAQQAELRRGDRLPSERDLAERLGTSRASVKQALVVLEVQGLVETRHGGGTFMLGDDLAAESTHTLLDRQARLPHVMEAREALECQAAGLAAVRRTEADLREMDAALELMARDPLSSNDAAEADRRFHAAVTRAAGNPLLSRFLGDIHAEVHESRLESLRQPGRTTQSLNQHRAVVTAIRKQDATAARAAMRRHLHSVGKVRLLDWSPALEELPASTTEATPRGSGAAGARQRAEPSTPSGA